MIKEETGMEPAGQEPLEALSPQLTDTNGQRERPPGPDAKDTEWVIERIQESFDSRAR